MIERDLSAIIDIVIAAYPDMGIILDHDQWQSGKFQPPCAFVQTQLVSMPMNTLNSYKVIKDAGIVLHHPKEEGEYIPISITPIHRFLMKHRFNFRAPTHGLYVNIDSESMEVSTDRKDRAEITFRFEYNEAIPIVDTTSINHFDVEERG